MRNFSFIHIFFFLLVALACKCANAQDYVVTTKGDTLTGKVKPLNFGPDKKVQVTDENKKKTTLAIFQTKAFSLKGETYNPVRTTDKGYVFMKLNKAGYLSIYNFQLENQTNYDGVYLLKKDGHGIEVPNLSFKKMLTRFLADCPIVADRVDNGELGKKDLETIVDEYNHCIDNKSHVQQVALAAKEEQLKGSATWTALEDKVNAQADFPEKANALDMIREIKNKVSKNEKVPNFLTEGLKNAVAETPLKDDVYNALKQLN